MVVICSLYLQNYKLQTSFISNQGLNGGFKSKNIYLNESSKESQYYLSISMVSSVNSLLIQTQKLLMSSFAKSANMFPYMDLWRIGGDPDINHVCGGLTSIIVFLLIVAICLAKTVEVFRMTTVFASSTVVNDLIPPLMNVTTFQNDAYLNSFMFAFSLQVGHNVTTSVFNPSDVEATAVYYSQDNNGVLNQSIVTTPISLESCTVQHFLSVPEVNTRFQKWGFNKFTCLALNQTFEIGGSHGFQSLYRSIKIDFKCRTTSCNSSTSNSLIFTAVTLDTFINPTNASIPQLSYATPYTIAFESNSYIQYSLSLDSNVVNTDSSILPIQKINSHQSFRSQGIPKFLSTKNDQPHTTILIEKSTVRATYDRTFLKLLDAVAYAGGIFQSILGIFFFMGGFGRLVYELEFASKFFKDKQVQNAGFFSYIKHSVFGILESLNFKPDWTLVQKQQEYQKTVNNLLDIVYLQKRISFLEMSIGVLFQSHQLKGLYLVHSHSKEEVDGNYRNHRFRNRFLCYLLKKQEKKLQRQPSCPRKNNEVNLESNNKEIQLQVNPQQQPFKEEKRNYEIKQFSASESAVDLKRGELDRNLYCNQDCIQQELQQDEHNDELLIYEIVKDLRKLVEEAEKNHGDARSQKIRELIGEQLWRKLKETILEGESKGLYYVIPPLNNE